jgi:hypothetical protein
MAELRLVEGGSGGPPPADSATFSLENFKAFCAALKVDTKNRGQISLSWDEMMGTQRFFVEEVASGLAEGVHSFVVLKGRQQGISTVCLALDLYWAMKHPGMSGSLVTHDEEARDMFKTTIEMYLDGLPLKFRVPVAAHNRTQLVFKNRSRVAYQVAGTRKNSKLGKGKGLTYLHGTEVAEWGDEEGFASLQAAMSETHPDRLEIYESTAQGFNFFADLWDRAEDSVSMRQVFIGWWRNEAYRKEPGSNEYRVYWDGKLLPEERKWVREVEERYGYEIQPEQIAWWRWMLNEKIGDQELMYQNHPPTAEYAFVASGTNFFSTARLSDEAKVVRKMQLPDLFRFVLRDNFEDCDITETIEKHCNLRVWEHAEDGGMYVVGADPAYGSSDWADRFCASVWRCYADGMEQVAEFCTESCNTYQFAWVVLYLAGHYRNTMINLEINGPGQAVWQEIQSMRRNAASNPKNPVSQKILFVVQNLQNYLYRRLDGFSRPSAYHWKSTPDTKERMLNFFKDNFERGSSVVRSKGLLEEMQKVVREEGQLGAPGRGKDDRVIAAGLAHVAWADFVRNQCIAKGLMKPKVGGQGDVKPQVQVIHPSMKGWLERIGVKA